MKVAAKLCGHCNPRRDMVEVFRSLEGAAPDMEFSFYSRDPEADILLILNACHVECAEVPRFEGPVIIVSDSTVDHWPVADGDLSQAILARIREVSAK